MSAVKFFFILVFIFSNIYQSFANNISLKNSNKYINNNYLFKNISSLSSQYKKQKSKVEDDFNIKKQKDFEILNAYGRLIKSVHKESIKWVLYKNPKDLSIDYFYEARNTLFNFESHMTYKGVRTICGGKRKDGKNLAYTPIYGLKIYSKKNNGKYEFTKDDFVIEIDTTKKTCFSKHKRGNEVFKCKLARKSFTSGKTKEDWVYSEAIKHCNMFYR